MSDLNNTVLVTLAILAGSFFSYLLQFFLGRGLSVADFGTFNTLLSLVSLVGVPASVLSTALIKEVSVLNANNQSKKISALFWQTVIWSFAGGLIIFGFFYFFKEWIFLYLKLTDQNLILAFITYLSLTFLGSVPFAYFQGLLKYKTYSVALIVSSVLRFGIPVTFLFLQPALSNIFLGLVIAIILSFVVSFLLLKGNLQRMQDFSALKELTNILKFSLPVMVINLCLISYNNSDLIMVRSHFDQLTAGYYAGVITVGKILLFGTMPVATVMYPKIASVKSKGQDVKRVMKKFLNMQLLAVGTGVIVFALFPRLISLAFFGNKYLESAKYLPFYALFVALYVLLNFFVLFLFAIDQTDIYKVMIGFAFLQIMLITKIHSTLYQILAINFITLLLCVLFALYKIYIYFKNEQKNETAAIT